jgi:hypothetical protein
VRYGGHYLKTRWQAFVQNAALLLVLVPALAWRAANERPVVAVALAMLTIAPFVSAFRGLRFLGRQEQVHTEPTPEMTFIFGLATVVPLTTSAFLLVVLSFP